MVTAYFVARKRGYPTEPFPGFHGGASFCHCDPGLLLIAIIFGGVRSVYLPRRKAPASPVIYALLMTVFVYRQMSWNDSCTPRMGAVRTTAMVLLIIGTAAAFSWLMAFLRFPRRSSPGCRPFPKTRS